MLKLGAQVSQSWPCTHIVSSSVYHKFYKPHLRTNHCFCLATREALLHALKERQGKWVHLESSKAGASCLDQLCLRQGLLKQKEN